MDLRELKVSNVRKRDRITTAALISALVLLLKRGLDQTNGNIRGPAQIKPITSVELLRYHFSFFLFSLSRFIYLEYPGFGLIGVQAQKAYAHILLLP